VSVRLDDAGTIVLDGDCPVEEAEALLELLQATPMPAVDWTRCTRLHGAVAQVILATRPAMVGPCGDGWIHRWFEKSP
jgi:hypothetical protein